MSVIQSPELIAHRLVTNVGSAARFALTDATATIPTTPYRAWTGVETTTVPLASFEAVIERVHIDDGGLSLTGFGGIHLPAREWRRIGLEKHWHADDVDLESPLTDPQRRLELWASREEAWDDEDMPAPPYDHLEMIPDDSPLITEWETDGFDSVPARPPVPFDRPTLSVYALHATGANDSQGFDRVVVGTIARVEILESSDLPETIEEPDIDTRTIEFDPRPPKHPQIEYADLEPLAQTQEVLQAVFTINRHAKRLGTRADRAYQAGRGANARVYSLQKRALYRSKTVAIHRLVKADPSAVEIVRHDLNGDHEMYCLSLQPVDNDEDRPYSFHQPLAAVAPELLSAVTGSEKRSSLHKETIEFDSSSETDSLEYSLSDAVCVLRSHGLDPDEYLDATVVEEYDFGTRFSTRF